MFRAVTATRSKIDETASPPAPHHSGPARLRTITFPIPAEAGSRDVVLMPRHWNADLVLMSKSVKTFQTYPQGGLVFLNT